MGWHAAQRRFAASELPVAFAAARDADSDDVTPADVAVYTAEVAAAAAGDASVRGGEEEGEGGGGQSAAEMKRDAEERDDGDGVEERLGVDGADVQQQQAEFEDEFGQGAWEGAAAAGRVAGVRPVSGARGEEGDEDDGGGGDDAAPAMWGVGGFGNDR